MQLAATHPNLRINSCSPGYVLTDLTAGMGASNTPEQSNCHVAPLFLLFDEPEDNGRYYGSDGVRSPLDRYRGPGDPPYVGD
jgi:carbonyl reductase 1